MIERQQKKKILRDRNSRRRGVAFNRVVSPSTISISSSETSHAQYLTIADQTMVEKMVLESVMVQTLSQNKSSVNHLLFSCGTILELLDLIIKNRVSICNSAKRHKTTTRNLVMKTVSAIPEKQLKKKKGKKQVAQNLVNFWHVYKKLVALTSDLI